MNNKAYFQIDGKEEGFRVESRILEERIQDAVEKGERRIEIYAFGQQGIGGRLWKAGDESIHVVIKGQTGQRVGSLGFPNTFIEVMGPASDDVGWLNAGSQIVVHGNAGNGLANAMAQGKIFVAGNIGARGMTMTKSNPRFDPPEIWVLGSVGDYFGEFMAGGIAVVCGVEPQTPDNVLGYRPLVGMVGGKIYFRGPHSGYSDADAKQVPISDEDWSWFAENLKTYLGHINRKELFETLSVREDWQLLVARTPQEKGGVENRAMSAFKADVWDKELGQGGMIGDLTTMDWSPIPLITTGELRRFVPVWENRKYKAPCEGTCPSGIPVHKRWRLIREGRIDEAVDLALEYTPFPATICGYLCPKPCMQACTRQIFSMIPIDITELGKASINARTPDFPAQSGKKIAVIGGGPAGISIAWQLRKGGHEAVIYDTEETLGGKMASAIPESRIPGDILTAELERISSVISHVHLKQRMERKETERLRGDYDFLVIAAGAQKPRMLAVPGKERMIPSLDFLMKSKKDDIDPGKKIVIVGAGNVGCDVATEAGRLGAESITLIDVQEPASFGKEREEAESYGAVFKWPCFTREITEEGVVLQTGELIPADTVVISIGDLPDTDFLPKSVEIKDGFVTVDEFFRTSDPKIFAIGDVVKPGILSDAIGAGRKAAEAIITILRGEKPSSELTVIIDTDRIKTEYFDPRITGFDDIDQCGSQCSSCGNCRDCGICIAICPQAAISREDLGEGEYQYTVDDSRCIGCGFCAGACPCGIWDLIENEPME